MNSYATNVIKLDDGIDFLMDCKLLNLIVSLKQIMEDATFL